METGGEILVIMDSLEAGRRLEDARVALWSMVAVTDEVKISFGGRV